MTRPALLSLLLPRSPALIGAVLALASLPIHLALDPRASIELAAVVVAAVGAIYASFGLQRGTPGQATVEVAVAALFVGAGLAGLWLSAWIIPAAFVAHGVWDTVHHRRAALVAVPGWYPPFCAVYDIVFAAGLTAVWLR